MSRYECKHGTEGCAFSPSYENERKKKWTFVGGPIDEEWFAKNDSITVWGGVYDSWDDFEADYEGEYEETPYLWDDYTGRTWGFCQDCHAGLMGRLIPTIMEEEDDLPASYYQDLLAA